jgi:uncharacterized Rossmann fold enzyme
MARLNWLGNGVGWTVAAAIASMALAAGGAQLAASQPTPQVVYAQQGWSDADRAAFYTTSCSATAICGMTALTSTACR